jgi:enoyl-CoA hydratase/carnithine racemase
MACDFVIASEWASFTWSYINRGIIADGGGMYFLPRRVGLAKAKELIFTGRKIEIDEASSLGIVDRRASAEQLLEDAQAWAKELSKGSATALALSKSILNQSFELPAHQIFAMGSQAQGICYTSTEHRQAVQLFLDKASAAKA